MLGKVKEIREVRDVHLFPDRGYDGYKVVTDKHVYHVLISNDQECCENWGYVVSYDNKKYFNDAELLEVRLTDVALDKVRFPEKPPNESGWSDVRGIQFVDFVTTQGVFQIAVYNEHNGYYGHGILLLQDDRVLLDDSV